MQFNSPESWLFLNRTWLFVSGKFIQTTVNGEEWVIIVIPFYLYVHENDYVTSLVIL